MTGTSQHDEGGLCPNTFTPYGPDTPDIDHGRTCYCGKPPGHEPPHVCLECGGRWGYAGRDIAGGEHE